MATVHRTHNGWVTEGYENFGAGIYRNYAVDSPDFPSNGLYDALNMVYELDSDDPEKMGGMVQLGSTLTGAPIVTGLFDYADGTCLIATDSLGNVYYRTTGAWTLVTGGTGFSADETARWTGGMAYSRRSGDNVLVMSNGVDPPQMCTGTSIATLEGSPPAEGKFFLSWLGHFWLFDNETAFYSVGDTCDDWTSAGSGNIGIALGEGGAITGARVFAGNLFVFKQAHTFRLAPKERVSDIYVDQLSSTRGAASHATIHDAGTEGSASLFFLSDYGVEACIPTSREGDFIVRSVSAAISDPLTRRNRQVQYLCSGVLNAQRKEYYCFYPVLGQTVPTVGLIGNVARSRDEVRWTRTDLKGVTASTMYRSSGSHIQVIGTNEGKIFQLHSGHSRDGAPYRGFVYTRAYTQGEVSRIKIYNRYFISTQTLGAYPVITNPLLGRYRMSPIPSGQATGIANPSDDGWGVGQWGSAQWGGSATSGRWARFKKGRRGTYVRLQAYTLGENQWFRLTGLEIESKLGSHITKTRD